MSFFDANTFVYSVIECTEHDESEAAVMRGGKTDALVLLETYRALLKITKKPRAR